MAALVLGAVGTAIGTGIGGGLLGISAATIGGAIGSGIGKLIDNAIISALTPAQRVEGPRLSEMTVMTSTEGAPMGRLHGIMRISGNLIWTTRFKETKTTETERVGGKGGPSQKVETTTYTYSVSMAIAFGEGNERTQLGRVWMDGKEVDLSKTDFEFYRGTEDQAPDSTIQSIEGAGNTPAFRGTTYIVFTDFDLTSYGNRIPQTTAEIISPLITDDPDDISNVGRSFCLIPGSGEFVYGTDVYTLQTGSSNVLANFFSGGTFTNQLGDILSKPNANGGAVTSQYMNMHTNRGETDFVRSMKQLELFQPNLDAIILVVGWFGDDLRIGECEVRPKVEFNDRGGVVTPREWNVDGLVRSDGDVLEVPRDGDGDPYYGGTPSDDVVVEAIQWLKARGHRVVFYPFIFMDITGDNTLPTPYSDNAATVGQPAFPWRGRITCSPAAGYAGTVDKTAAAATQVNNFFTGTWGVNRMIEHYANLCNDAGGVDGFVIGTEMPGMTTIRSNADTYPAIAHLKTLASTVKGIVGGSCDVGYAADWSEYHSHRPADGSGDIYYPMDALWSDANIDFIGIDNYLPISDWRDGSTHLDFDADNGIVSPHNLDYLRSNIEGGEGYDWFYASDTDREDQVRTPIADNQYGEHWVYRQKDIRNWWQNPHFNRPGGAGQSMLDQSNTPDVWTGTATVTSDANTYGNFTSAAALASNGSTGDYGGTSSTGSDVVLGETYEIGVLFKPGTSNALRIYLAVSSQVNPQIRVTDIAGEVFSEYAGVDAGTAILEDIGSGFYRLTYQFTATVNDSSTPLRVGPQSSTAGEDVIVLGAWVKCLTATSDISTDYVPGSKPIWFTEFGCPAVDKGTNQPNVFYDPKSSESFFPYHSSGRTDEYIPRVYAEAMLTYWRDNAPAGMLSTDNMFIWCWDSRPYPDYPYRTDVWSDGPLWDYGHWMTGRLAYPALPRLVEEMCEEVGVTNIDTSKLNGAQALVRGYYIDNVMATRDMIGSLMTGFQFDAFESQGTLKFALKSSTVLVPLQSDDFVSTESDPTGFNITRIQTTELPSTVQLDFLDPATDYEVSSLDAKRHAVTTQETAQISLPMVLQSDYVRALGDSVIHQAWAARENGSVMLPPSLYKLDPGDGITFPLDSRTGQGRIQSIDTGEAREVTFQGFDLSLFNLPVYPVRARAALSNAIAGFPELFILDIPLFTGEEPSHWSPRLATWAKPWPGSVAVYQDFADEGDTADWSLVQTLSVENTLGRLFADVGTGKTGVWLRNAEITVQLFSGGTLGDATDTQVLNGANACAMQNDQGSWEIFQYGTATLNSDGTYTMTDLIRGQLGTEWVMDEATFSEGNAFVLIENQFSTSNAAPYLPLGPGDRGNTVDVRFGSAYEPVDDDLKYLETTHTHTAAAQKPYAPAQLRAKWNLSVSNDIVLTWLRRSRFNADSWDIITVPLNEETEEYELEILDGSTVVREVTGLTSPAYTYTDAMQVEDFGSAQTANIKFRVYQMSANVGRGNPAEETITR